MKKLLLVLFAAASISVSSQTCNATSFSPITICAPSSTISIAQGVQTDMIYLCGPNSVVYDTLTPPSIKFRVVYVKSGGTYILKSNAVSNSIHVYAKTGSNFVILPGSTANNVVLDQEASVTYVNAGTGSVTVNNCIAITAPTAAVNCSVTGVPEFSANENTFLWPNPADDILTVKTSNGTNVHCFIFDCVGRVVREEKWNGVEEKKIKVQTLPSGIYYLSLNVNGKVQTKKIVIAR